MQDRFFVWPFAGKAELKTKKHVTHHANLMQLKLNVVTHAALLFDRPRSFIGNVTNK